MIQSRLFLLRDNNFIHGALSDLTLCRMFSFTYTLHERSFSKIHNRGTLRPIHAKDDHYKDLSPVYKCSAALNAVVLIKDGF